MTVPLLALDTPWLLYRSFFGVPRSIKGAGELPVGALLGTVNTILTLIDTYSPRAVVCCLGAEDARYRRELYPRYHAHREPMPAELRTQWDRAGELLAAFGWTVRGHEELEADDVLWSCSRVEGASGGRTLIATADRDLYQAVDQNTAVLELRRDEPPRVIDAAGVVERSGVTPAQIPDLIALRGEKTAAALLREHGTLAGVLAATDGLRPSIAVALTLQAEELRVFRDIATLRDVPFERPADRATDRLGGAGAARALGMNALARRREAA
jgi:DNA polymerase-1